jgi:hypothetical protein
MLVLIRCLSYMVACGHVIKKYLAWYTATLRKIMFCADYARG